MERQDCRIVFITADSQLAGLSKSHQEAVDPDSRRRDAPRRAMRAADPAFDAVFVIRPLALAFRISHDRADFGAYGTIPAAGLAVKTAGGRIGGELRDRIVDS